MNVHALSSHEDAEVAKMVREAMREAKLSEETIEAFSQSDLSKMHRFGGYTTALFIKNDQRAGLEKCGLTPALVDHMVSALERQHKVKITHVYLFCKESFILELMIFVSTGLAYTFGFMV